MVYERYGPPGVLELRDVPIPTMGNRDLLVKVHSVSVNRSDWECLIGKPLYARVGGLFKPGTQILGTDLAGVVESVGSEVTSFKPGDEVYGDLMYHGGRTFAEYVKVSERAPLIPKPRGLSFAQASALPQAGAIAYQGTSKIKKGDRVLINGAGGGAGALALQLAKQAGANVTGVDNGHKQEFMRSFGADQVIDYAKEDYTRSGRYDLILDLVAERSIFARRRALAPNGRYLVVGGHVRSLLSTVTTGKLLATGGRKLGVLSVRPSREGLQQIGEMVTSGVLKIPIDRTYPLASVPQALLDLGEGRALGKLVIEVASE